MAKRGAIIDMGRHKAVQSQFSPLVIQDEQMPLGLSHSVYYTGQAGQWQAEYDAKVAADAKREAQTQALQDLKEKLLDKGLL